MTVAPQARQLSTLIWDTVCAAGMLKPFAPQFGFSWLFRDGRIMEHSVELPFPAA